MKLPKSPEMGGIRYFNMQIHQPKKILESWEFHSGTQLSARMWGERYYV